jgi:hypothetical protein
MDRSRLSGPAGVEVRYISLADLAGLSATADEVDLVVVDLARPGALEAVAAVTLDVPLVGFGPHVDDELLAAATAAGCDRVLPRSRFFTRWPNV